MLEALEVRSMCFKWRRRRARRQKHFRHAPRHVLSVRLPLIIHFHQVDSIRISDERFFVLAGNAEMECADKSYHRRIVVDAHIKGADFDFRNRVTRGDADRNLWGPGKNNDQWALSLYVIHPEIIEGQTYI